MFKEAMNQIRIATVILVFFSILTGLIYPAIVTSVAQLLFPRQANGSLIEHNGKMIGSELIGQSFTDPKYFWSRPSGTSPFPYNGESSSGSNMGPSNPNFLASIKERVASLRQVDLKQDSLAAQDSLTAMQLTPVDLVTASASGLDPEICPNAAFYQIPRISKARNISEEDLKKLIKTLIKNRTFGLLGEPRINVLLLNLALDNQFPQDKSRKSHD